MNRIIPKDIIEEILKHTNILFIKSSIIYVSKVFYEVSKNYSLEKLYKHKLFIELCRIFSIDDNIKLFEKFDFHDSFIYNNICRYAAKVGNLHLLKFCWKELYSFSNEMILYTAAKYGNIECIEYLLSKNDTMDLKGCIIGNNIYSYAALSGNPKCLNFVIDNVHIESKDGILSYAIRSKNIECIEIALQYEILDKHNSIYLMKPGNIELIKYFDSKYQFTSTDILVAAGYGNIEVLKYFYKRYATTIHESMTIALSNTGDNFECIKYLCDIGARINETAFIHAARNKSLEILDYLFSEYMYRRNNGEVLYLSMEFPELECISAAIRYDNIDNFRYIHNIGCIISDQLIQDIIRSCAVKCLKYVYEDSGIGLVWTKQLVIISCIYSIQCFDYIYDINNDPELFSPENIQEYMKASRTPYLRTYIGKLVGNKK